MASDASREGRILTLKKKSGVWEVTERVRTYDGVALGEGVSVGDAQMILDVIRRTRSVQPWEDDETYSIPESREHLPRRIARDYVVHYIDGELEAGTPSLELDKQADFAVSTHDPKAERIGGEDIFVRWQEIFLRRTESGMEAIAIF